MSNRGKFSKIFRISTIIFASLILLFIIALFTTQKWLELNLADILNADPGRAYTISYEELDMAFLLNGFKLKNASILPLEPNDS